MKTKLILEGEDAKPLVLAATGCPHFVIVQDHSGRVHSKVTEDFDMEHVFNWLRDFAHENSDFCKALADFVIDVAVNDIDV